MTANGGFGSLCLSSFLPGTLRPEWLAVVYLVVALGRSRPQRRALLRVSGSAFTTLHYDFLPRGERRVGTASLSTSAPPR